MDTSSFFEDVVARAESLREESEKLSGLLCYPEVASDGKLMKYYSERVRALEPVCKALERYHTAGDREELIGAMAFLEASSSDSSSFAGAGVYACRHNNNITVTSDDALRHLSLRMSSFAYPMSIEEKGDDFLRAEWTGDKAYAALSALPVEHEGWCLAVYPILRRALPIAEADVRTDIFNSHGKGGQNVNKVETAVRMTHLPTGVTVTCQDERSQLQNKKRAARILADRVKEYYVESQTALVARAKKRVRERLK